MVADIKYSQERGVQICEVQHGIDSVFKGELFSNQGFSLITENFVEFFSSFDFSYWMFKDDINDPGLTETLLQTNWIPLSHPSELDITSFKSKISSKKIKDYSGFVLSKSKTLKKIQPSRISTSLIFVDQGILPIRKDKYFASLCFKGDPILESCKPKWNIYKKKYHKKLANQIIQDLQCAQYVIKPRGRFSGNGVILVDRQKLDSTLKYILNKSKKLKNDPDRAYRAWYNEKMESFLVEEFVPADPIIVPHLESKPFYPTIRIAFLGIYEEEKHKIHFLGGYYCLPEKSFVDEGDLHQKYKASLETIHSAKIDEETYHLVTEQLYEPLCLFYKKAMAFELN